MSSAARSHYGLAKQDNDMHGPGHEFAEDHGFGKSRCDLALANRAASFVAT